jgi:hypothetical protein
MHTMHCVHHIALALALTRCTLAPFFLSAGCFFFFVASKSGWSLKYSYYARVELDEVLYFTRQAENARPGQLLTRTGLL